MKVAIHLSPGQHAFTCCGCSCGLAQTPRPFQREPPLWPPSHCIAHAPALPAPGRWRFCCGLAPLPKGPLSHVLQKATARRFEPLRAEPNGFRVHLLNRSDTLSWLVVDHACLESKHKDSSHEVERLPAPEASGARVCSCRSCAEKWQFWAGREVGQGFSCLKRARRLGLEQATARGFEPLRAEPNGFRVHHLSHSVTLS